jgi:hypothetical protein
LVESEAYGFNGERLVPVGSRAAMARAFQIDPAVAGAISAEHVRASSAASSLENAPLDRARARLQTMGIDMDRSLSGEDDVSRDLFCGVDLNNLPKGAA